jgi:N-acetyl-anhydromuramyl-L-alanine amidase AmpD
MEEQHLMRKRPTLALVATAVVLPLVATLTLTARAGAAPAQRAAASPTAECPTTLTCDFVPAAYVQNDPANPQNYGNYDTANRPADGLRIDHIVLHDVEGTYASAIGEFTNPRSFTSAHYVIRAADGHVTQMVRTGDVAWQAGNWYLNTHSIGIELEGFAVGGTGYTEQEYTAAARLVCYLAAKYGIPLDRQHIIGHDNVGGDTATRLPTMHWDPGPFFDWNHFMALVGRPIAPTAAPASPVLTINHGGQQVVTDCLGDGSALPPTAASFVYLRTAPDPAAPLVSDPALHPDGAAGSTCASDWGDKASTGEQLVVAGRQGQWTAVWWGGVRAWFLDTPGVSVPSTSARVTPKPGLASIPVYGRAYPEAAAYVTDVPVQALAPLQYTLGAGQWYTTVGPVRTDYYHAKTIDSSLPGDHTVVVGQVVYYQIQLNHRLGYVRATDVDVTR